jgi:hypothetical protein
MTDDKPEATIRQHFNELRDVLADLHAAVRKAKREHKRVAVRLNVFSDLQWESLMPTN